MNEELIKRLRMAAKVNDEMQPFTPLVALLNEAADALSSPAPAVQVPEGKPLCYLQREHVDLLRAGRMAFPSFISAQRDGYRGDDVPVYIAAPAATSAEAVQVPEGWKLVPVEPMQEQISAAREETDRQFGAYGERADYDDTYRVMVAAAPAPIASSSNVYGPGSATSPAAAHMLATGAFPATVATEAVAQGGGVDVEKVMVLVERFGVEKWAYGRSYEADSAEAANALFNEIRALLTAAPAGVGGLEPVEGDLLPPVGSKVLIHLASPDAWVEHTVAGYYVWGDLGGNKHLHRVFVRVVSESGYPNARMLHEVRPLPAAPAIAKQEARDGR